MAVADPPLAVHATLNRSSANGPGDRFVIWVQGCTLACPGCFNPETHRSGEPSQNVDELAEQVLAVPNLEGVTLTGGEPLQQPEAVAALLRRIRQRSNLGVVLISGFTEVEIRADERLMSACRDVDVVVAGRYNRGLHLAAGLRGSSNKSYWFLTDRYEPTQFEELPDTEIVITPTGELVATGMFEWEMRS